MLPRLRDTKYDSALDLTARSEGLWKNEEFLGRYLKTTPLGRTGKPGEIVGAVLYLASDAGAYVTGDTIVLGGSTLT